MIGLEEITRHVSFQWIHMVHLRTKYSYHVNQQDPKVTEQAGHITSMLEVLLNLFIAKWKLVAVDGR